MFIGPDAAACHLLNNVAPRPADIEGRCRGLSENFGGYAVVTPTGAPSTACAVTASRPWKRSRWPDPRFPGRGSRTGKTVRIGNMVVRGSRVHAVRPSAHRAHGFMISAADYDVVKRVSCAG